MVKLSTKIIMRGRRTAVVYMQTVSWASDMDYLLILR
jgi:hypothetical protein